MSTMIAFSFSTLKENFYNDFIVDDRWKWLVDGLGVTLKVTIMASLLGIVIGLMVALIKVSQFHGRKIPVLSQFADAYVLVIRGTPAVVQLLIIYYVVFASVAVDKVCLLYTSRCV